MHRSLGLGAFVAVLVLVFLPMPLAMGQDAGRLLFRARVSDLWLQTSSYAKNRHPDACLEVALSGRLHHPPVSVGLIERSAADWSTAERAMESIRSANAAGDRGWLIDNFVTKERSDLISLLDDSAIIKRNQDHYRSIQALEITGSAELRGHTVLFTRQMLTDALIRIAPATLVKTTSGWRQTNALSRDEAFDVVWAALRADKVKGRTLGSC